MKIICLLSILLHSGFAADGNDVIKLKIGFVTKIACEGRLFISAIGNEALVRIEALPKELGCAVILKPMGVGGSTNLILETSAGTLQKKVLVVSH